MKELVKVENLKKSFGKISALRGATLTLEERQQYVVRGASGSGKSTLLHLLAGLDRPSGGKIWVAGKDLAKYSDKELGRYRNQFIGLVFQFHFLLPSMDCLSNVLLPARIGNVSVDKVKQKVLDLAAQLGVVHCLGKFPYELSGGEQQRINIIRAISLEPKLILCDEPTGSLDSDNTDKVVDLLKDLASHTESTLVVVTHDDKVARQFPNKFFIQDGVVVN
ncbi:MAG: ABC transporter ATP-binding protein [Bdellovibrionales bacterium]|jgi:lipoprotein-releasing system ATP-binding protein|nr:ABC transporter ATP-binding protein [Bdellovibrionales bacterium]